jgi:azurin
MLFIVSCKNEPAKEKFSYERIQEDVEKIESAEQTIIVLNSNDLMLFDKTSLSAKAGKNIRLTLNHTGKIGKEFMGHNFVLLKKDVDVDDFAMLALDFKENEYIPKNNDFIVHTRMLGGGESETINFTIEEPSIYTYVCTFPGHYQIMQGTLTIE